MNINIWKALRTVPGTESTVVYISVCYYQCYKTDSHRTSHKEKLLSCTIQEWKGKGLGKTLVRDSSATRYSRGCRERRAEGVNLATHPRVGSHGYIRQGPCFSSQDSSGFKAPSALSPWGRGRRRGGENKPAENWPEAQAPFCIPSS